MAANDPTAGGRRSFAPVIVATGALALLSFVIVVVNYWIYRARADFIALHPAFSAEQPPTISKAITDPSIGEPFAVWISISAVALAAGVIPLAWLHYRSAGVLPPGRPRRVLEILAVAMCLSQFASCVGMVILANWRGPDHGDGHMFGSYIFFASQTLVVLLVAVSCHLAGKYHREQAAGGPFARLVRFRGRLATLSVALAALFIALFVTKGFDFEYGYALMYQVYVLSEPVAITCYLLVIATYYPELVAMARPLSGSSRPILSASQTPD